ncbi:MAG: hypothetical protein HY421_00860 [Candidatus Kerfeldbacteria bacterium]|nr:hypothetical protein [Candidatus Kerfeldbacteria bacterium]
MNGDQPTERVPLHQTRLFRILVVVVIVVGAVVAAALTVRTRRPAATNGNATVINGSVPPANLDTRQGIPLQDGDQDGLTNEEEDRLGTNPTQADSDRDGLSDFDEVRVYRSDPNQPDTDGDGHTDGQEVQQGFSPTGPGKLFDTVPPPTTPTT